MSSIGIPMALHTLVTPPTASAPAFHASLSSSLLLLLLLLISSLLVVLVLLLLSLKHTCLLRFRSPAKASALRLPPCRCCCCRRCCSGSEAGAAADAAAGAPRPYLRGLPRACP